MPSIASGRRRAAFHMAQSFGWQAKPEYRARYPDARPIPGARLCAKDQSQHAQYFQGAAAGSATTAALQFSRDANTGAGQDFTGLAAAVQLRLRVAFGLQALPRCSGLLNRRARGSTVATHHFGGGTRIEKSMRGFGADAQRYSFCLPLPPPFQTLP